MVIFTITIRCLYCNYKLPHIMGTRVSLTLVTPYYGNKGKFDTIVTPYYGHKGKFDTSYPILW